VVSSIAELESESARGRVRIVIAASLRGAAARVLGSDVEITQQDGVFVEHLLIDHARQAARRRIAVRGGSYGQIATTPAARFAPTVEAHPEWLAEDITIDGVRIEAAKTAMLIYARRIAVVRSRFSAKAYAIYSDAGPGGSVSTEDLLIAGNRFTSAGDEATIRLISVVRSIVIDNVLHNAIKHNYRVHGRSDLALAARNIMIVTGAAIGFMPDDQVGRVWLLDNTVYHTINHLMHAEPGHVRAAHVRGNIAYTDLRKCVLCLPSLPSGWEDEGNRALPYQEPRGL
jgi:hypothetical protein